VANHIFTVDLEDWLQSSLEFYRGNPWPQERTQPTAAVRLNALRLLVVLSRAGVKATWFVLGSVAERFRDLVLEVNRQGHEIGAHGFEHNLVYRLSPQQFREDLRRVVGLLQGITGERVRGYRAPYFSITRQSAWALDILAEEGLAYDSSLFPIRRRLYGFPGTPPLPHRHPNGLIELPITTISLGRIRLPLGGGGYFRMMPLVVFLRGYARLEKAGNPIVFYMHPYELDATAWKSPLPGENLRFWLARHRQGFGRDSFEARLNQLLTRFHFATASAWIEDNLRPSDCWK